MFFLKGLLIGFAIAAPVGPIGVLCIRRTFADGRLAGFVTGLGAATADAFYGAVAGFGLSAISGFLLKWQLWLQVGGGLFLVGLGIQTFMSKPSTMAPRMEETRLLPAYLMTVLLTAANPATILSFAAVFAGAGLVQGAGNYLDASLLVLGVFAGSAAWWFVLSTLIAKYRDRHPEFAHWADYPLRGAVVTGLTLGVASKTLRQVSQTSGVVLALFGIAALVPAIL